MKYTSISEIGLIRSNNQDSATVIENENALLAVVCDGIGGANAGEVASNMVKSLLKESFLEKGSFKSIEEVRKWFVNEIKHINKTTFHESLVVKHYSGMGTTLAALVVLGTEVVGFNIGDSRIYSLHEGKLECLSHDQTYAYEMYLRKEIDFNEIDTHPKRNVLMNAVGIDEDVKFEIIQISKPWDYLMISSDGLHGYVPFEKIQETFELNDILSIRQELLKLSYEAGGYDNISIVLIEGDRDE
ncbi:MAG: protein phosphatase 2C domain-containing protein [Erysipelothrix sp.]